MNGSKAWTVEEDKKLQKLVNNLGEKNWKVLANSFNKLFPGKIRTAKMCRNRWLKISQSSLYKKNWSIFEEFIFYEAHNILGNRWSSITKYLPKTSDNHLKNHFYSNLRKVLRKIVKNKFNYVDFKEKVKAFYTIIYVKNHFIQVQVSTFEESSTKNSIINKYQKYIHNENTYVFKLLKRQNINEEMINDYLKKLCNYIIKDKFVKERISYYTDSNSFYDTEKLIKSLVYYEIMKYCLNYANNHFIAGDEQENLKKNKILKFVINYKHLLPTSINNKNLTKNNKDFIVDLTKFANNLNKENNYNNQMINKNMNIYNSLNNKYNNNVYLYPNNFNNNSSHNFNNVLNSAYNYFNLFNSNLKKIYV